MKAMIEIRFLIHFFSFLSIFLTSIDHIHILFYKPPESPKRRLNEYSNNILSNSLTRLFRNISNSVNLKFVHEFNN